MNVLDLFSGACGGWSLGLHRAGFATVAACEIDEWRRAQYARNFPSVRLYADVRELSAERLRADGIGPIDIVAGSPPCQDASTANTKGKGIEGERTGLYLEAVRLVREIRPRWYAFENVPGIRNRGIDRVLGELERAGYAAWPLVVGASDLGAPHIRKRSWLIGADAETVQRLAPPWNQSDGNLERAPFVANGEGQSRGAVDGEMERFVDGPGQSDTEGRASAEQSAVIADSQGVGSGTGLREARTLGHRTIADDRPALERAISERLGSIAQNWNGGIAGRFGMDDGLPKGMARPLLAAYGDTILPQIAEIIGRAILNA